MFPDRDATPPPVCTQCTISTNLYRDEAAQQAGSRIAATYQQSLPRRWWDRYQPARAAVEGLFGNPKPAAGQNLAPGTIHLKGRARMTIMVAFAVAAPNLRLVERFPATRPHADVPHRRRVTEPPRRTALRSGPFRCRFDQPEPEPPQL